MSVMIIISYLLVGGQWRVSEATQSAPTQAMFCADHVAEIRTRAVTAAGPDVRIEVVCQRQPVDI